MIKVLLISHGPFCEGLLESIQMITGPQENIVAVPLIPGMSPDTYKEKVEEQLDDETIVFCDLKGGTPYNTIGSLSRSHNVKVVTGMNIPMLITLVTLRNEDSKAEELIQEAIKEENTGIGIENFEITGGKRSGKLSLNKNR